MDLSILFIPFQKVVFLCEGRALEVAKAVLPSHSPPGYADSGNNSANWQSIHTILSRPDTSVEFF